jgi:hypothetical protein
MLWHCSSVRLLYSTAVHTRLATMLTAAADTNMAVTDDELINAIRAQAPAGTLPPPAPPGAVTELEATVGHPMPPLLKRIYLEVADGGFGRWGGALSLTDTTYRFSDSGPLLEEYLGWANAPDINHPPAVVPLLTWGCAVWSLVDYSTPEGRMWGWEPNARCLRHALFPEDLTLAERLKGWLDGRDDFPQPPARNDCPAC